MSRAGDLSPWVGPRVAVIERRGKFLVAEPFFERGPRMAISRTPKASAGDLVVVGHSRVSAPGGPGGLGGPGGPGGSGELGDSGGRGDSGGQSGAGGLGGSGGPGGGRPRGRHARAGGRPDVLRRIGRPDVARDVIEALMVDRGLFRRFDPAVEREARLASQPGVEVAGRRDLRAMPTFTIDPVSARDFDDAVSAEPVRGDGDGGPWRVWVHIADVSAFVPHGSLVDREAYRRATSVYVPGAVEPMLPEALSNGVCSLVPGEDRYAVSVEMVVGTDGTVTRPSFHRSVIRSDERLDYDRVDEIFAGTERAHDPWAAPLRAARAAAAALGARRAGRGALVVDNPEPEFSFGRGGEVIGARPVAQTESHKLIEALMIAANEQVAGLLEARKLPALFRVHARPEATAVLRLAEQLASLDVPTPPLPGEHISPQQAEDAIGELSAAVGAWVRARRGLGRRGLSTLVLRSLKQAYYDPRNLGHAGLRSPRYCHFTSPIRRYPDLICHRSLLFAIGAEPGLPPPDAGWVAAAGPWTSTRERAAMVLERDADDVARCFLLSRRLASGELSGGAGHEFEGEVVSLIGAGAFVEFGEERFQGLLPVRRLRGDWWELNELGTVLIGTHGGGAIRIGDSVRVTVGEIDAPRGRVDLHPVEL